MKYSSLLRDFSLIGFACFFPTLCVHATPVSVQNPTFSGTAAPDEWRAYPPPDGTNLVVQAQASGGTKMTVVNVQKGAGMGFAQWIPVTPGNKYTVTLDTDGTGGLLLSMTLVPKIPGKFAMIEKTKLAEQHAWVAAEKKQTTISVVAPKGSTNAWLWVYCPKGNPKCDILLKSIKVEEDPADATSVAAANTAAAVTAASNTAAAAAAPAKAAAPAAPQPEKPVKDLPNGILQKIDFETGDFSQVVLKEGGKKEVVTAPEPVRAGKYAMKVMLTHDQHRTEVTGLRSEPYGEYKYGWSIFIPKDFDSTSFFSIVTQWHSWGSGKEYPIVPPGPPTCITISKDAWQFKLIYQDGETDKTAIKYFPFGPVEGDRGKWTDFVMEVNWQSPKSGGGYLRLFKNGEKVIDYQGPTWFEGKVSGPYFKMGIYKGSGAWKGEESGAILYFDEARAGKGVTKDDVDPAKQH